MFTNHTSELLSEALRPQSLDELNLPEQTIASFKKMELSGSPIHLLLYGPPGVGKTSAARILTRNSDVLLCNGADCHVSNDARPDFLGSLCAVR